MEMVKEAIRKTEPLLSVKTVKELMKEVKEKFKGVSGDFTIIYSQHDYDKVWFSVVMDGFSLEISTLVDDIHILNYYRGERIKSIRYETVEDSENILNLIKETTIGIVSKHQHACKNILNLSKEAITKISLKYQHNYKKKEISIEFKEDEV